MANGIVGISLLSLYLFMVLFLNRVKCLNVSAEMWFFFSSLEVAEIVCMSFVPKYVFLGEGPTSFIRFDQGMLFKTFGARCFRVGQNLGGYFPFSSYFQLSCQDLRSNQSKF